MSKIKHNRWIGFIFSCQPSGKRELQHYRALHGHEFEPSPKILYRTHLCTSKKEVALDIKRAMKRCSFHPNCKILIRHPPRVKIINLPTQKYPWTHIVYFRHYMTGKDIAFRTSDDHTAEEWLKKNKPPAWQWRPRPFGDVDDERRWDACL